MKTFVLKWGSRLASATVIVLATIPSVFGTFHSVEAGRAWMGAIALVALVGMFLEIANQERTDAQLNRIEHSSADTLESNRRMLRLLSARTPNTLRGRATILSARILAWISELEASILRGKPKAQPGTANAIIAEAITKWHLLQETNTIFEQQFASDVIAVRNELQQAKASDAFIDSFVPRANTPDAIRVLAVHLGHAADRLPDED